MYRNFKVSADSPLPFGERARVRGGMLKRLTTLTPTLSLFKGEGEEGSCRRRRPMFKDKQYAQSKEDFPIYSNS